MREIIDLIEGKTSYPDWLERGHKVKDPSTINDDCHDILEPHEWDWKWRLCDIPVSAFEVSDFDDFKPDFTGFAPSEERFERIRARADYDPVICAFWKGELTLLDGHHRLYVIAAERGDPTIKALVGIGKPVPC